MDLYKADAITKRTIKLFKQLNAGLIAIAQLNGTFSKELTNECEHLRMETYELLSSMLLEPNTYIIDQLQEIKTVNILKAAMEGYFRPNTQAVIDLLENIGKLKCIEVVDPIITMEYFNALSEKFIEGVSFNSLNYVLVKKELPIGQDKIKWKNRPVEAYRFSTLYNFSIKEFNSCFDMKNGRKLKLNDEPKTLLGKINEIHDKLSDPDIISSIT